MRKYPLAPQKATILTQHNHARTDDYYWMNARDSSEVLNYIAAENEHSSAYFASHLNTLKDTLLEEFDQRINPNEVYAPFIVHGKTFQFRMEAGKEYGMYVELGAEAEQLFLDENERAAGHAFYALGTWELSPNNELVALSEDSVGRRKYTIRFRVNASGKFLSDVINDTDGSVVWANDNKTVYYVKTDVQTLREYQVYRHIIGTDTSLDELIYQEDDERFSVGISKSITHAYIFIQSFSSTTSEFLLVDANDGKAYPQVFLARQKGHLYEVEHHETGFYILSNGDGAKNNRLLLAPQQFPIDLGACREVVPHSAHTLIEEFYCFQRYIVLASRTNGLLSLRVLTLQTGVWNELAFDEETYTASLAFHDDYTATELYFNYNSMTTPASVFCYDMATLERTRWFQQVLIDPLFDAEAYTSERVWALANDGTKIPISLVYKKGLELQQAPCLVYGYSSYGYTLPDVFSATRLSLLNRGFVYAVVHARGSKYMGEEWYEDGKLLRKKNTFTDFINAAEWLAMHGYCAADKLYAKGGSAGGLLMGAVMNMAPYLWKGVIAQVPFVDVVTTMLDTSIPLTVGEYEEWGNPQERDYYYYMLSYSPYDRVKAMPYPPLYVTTGYHDSQVQYWEPLKWVAKLRALRTNDAPLLLECNMDAGHGGGSGRTQEREEIAKAFSFILNLEGIEK